ncbi:hypothetical protein [Nocardiopsis sp. NPDC058789]|uniref:hypothetical protein n=1 Tax=Nocardiopsis sp. NPDC058789 TaxID=3346634 RepID=UPI00366AF734
MNTRNHILLPIAALTMALASCATEADRTGDTIDRHQAEERVEEHLQNSTGAFAEDITLENAGAVNTPPCDDARSGVPEGLVQVSKGYRLRDLPHEDNGENVRVLIEHWESNGYAVREDARGETNFVSVEHEDDGFVLSLRESVQGTVTLRAASPCIWPEGTPD